MKNTKEKGQFRFIIYKKPQDKYFTGVCLDLDIFEQDKNPEQLKRNLLEAAQGYLEAVKKKDLTDELLNQPSPKKYWQILKDLEKYFHLMHQISEPRQLFPLEDSQVFTKDTNELACV